MTSTLALTKELINRPSITPEDGGCQLLLADRLAKMGFEITHLPFGEVKNLWARRGAQSPLLVFVGHTDVVPTGPEDKWRFPPFTATEQDGFLYGRGAADMKSNIAAMVTACERFIAQHPHHQGSIAFLITSDEEGPSINGTAKVVEYLQQQNIHIDWCIVGEPSSQQQLGDMVKIGRRGSLSATLTIIGKQGHIAYPHLADNPIHRAIPTLHELIHTNWDPQPHALFPKTSLQISNIHAGTGANNVIPHELTLLCNFRYAPTVAADNLQQQFKAILDKHDLHYQLDWHHSGKPFITEKSILVKRCVNAIQSICNITPELSTTGGTSDGRFIAPLGAEIIELGVCNDTIHQIDERASIADINKLSELYEKMLINLFEDQGRS